MFHKAMILFFLSLLPGKTTQGDEPILVGCAANFRLAMSRILSQFEIEHQQSEIKVVYASSGKLAAQILHGAPYDIFLAADLIRPQRILQAGFGFSKVVPYAVGSLIVFSQRGLSSDPWNVLLTDPGLSRIAIANPALAPYGKATMDTIIQLGLFNQIESKIVYGENIMQTAHLTLKATDIGFLSRSSLEITALKPFNREGTYWRPIDTSLHEPIVQGMLLLKTGSPKIIARTFFEFMTSDKVSQILVRAGYTTPRLNPKGATH